MNTYEEIDFIKRCIKLYWEYYANREHPDNQDDWNTSQQILRRVMGKDIRYITFGCSGSIHLYKKEGGLLPSPPYKPHNSLEEARTYLIECGVKDIKIIKHYEE